MPASPWLQRLERAWHAKAYDRYGSTQSGNDHMFACELGIGTRERPGTLHNTDPYHIVEVLDPESGRHVEHGEEGEIYMTSLYRTDTPAIRVRMRDRAVWHEPGSCPCGRPYSGAEMCSIGARGRRQEGQGREHLAASRGRSDVRNRRGRRVPGGADLERHRGGHRHGAGSCRRPRSPTAGPARSWTASPGSCDDGWASASRSRCSNPALWGEASTRLVAGSTIAIGRIDP